MLKTGTYNISCPQGVTFDETFTMQQGGSPINLTGYSARMQIRRSYDAAPILTLTSPSSGITLGGALGTIRVQISYTTTESLASGQYLYDLEITSAGDVRDRLLSGTFSVSREVTRSA